MKTSESIKELAASLSKAQGEIEGAIKDSKNPHFKSSYADLASVMDAIREPFRKYGLSYSQHPVGRNLVTILMHQSGEFIQSEMELLVEKPNMQGLGSAITYARRYSLAAIAGVAQVDDDGNEASRFPAQVQASTPVRVEPVKAQPVTGAAGHEQARQTAIRQVANLMVNSWSKDNLQLFVSEVYHKQSLTELTFSEVLNLTGYMSKHGFDEALALAKWGKDQPC